MRRRRLGVSYLITVVLMTLVAVALGTLLYAYFSGWVGSRTGAMTGPVAVLSIEEAYYDNTKGFVIYVRNDGVGTVNITKVYLTSPSGKIYTADIKNKQVKPGKSIEVNVTTSQANISDLETGVWKIKVVANDGSSAVTTVRV